MRVLGAALFVLGAVLAAYFAAVVVFGSTLHLLDGSTMHVFGLTRDVYAYHGWFGVSVPSAFVVAVE